MAELSRVELSFGCEILVDVDNVDYFVHVLLKADACFAWD